MKIQLNKEDIEHYGVDIIITPVVDVAIQEEKLINVVCDILLHTKNWTEKIYKDVHDTLNDYELLLGEDEALKEKYVDLKKHLDKFFWEITNGNFVDDVKKNDNATFIKEGLNLPPRMLARYRGLMFEELASAVLKTRFADNESMTGCSIKIDGSQVQYVYRDENNNLHRKMTFDFAGWKNPESYGEFYEYKISPDRFLKENYMLFKELHRVLTSNMATAFTLGLVSAEPKASIDARLRSVESTIKGTKINIRTFGGDNLHTLWYSPEPSIA